VVRVVVRQKPVRITSPVPKRLDLWEGVQRDAEMDVVQVAMVEQRYGTTDQKSFESFTNLRDRKPDSSFSSEPSFWYPDSFFVNHINWVMDLSSSKMKNKNPPTCDIIYCEM